MTTGNNDVTIKYGGQLFDIQTNVFAPGSRKPVPLISINSTSNIDKDNNILSIVSSIELEGVIIGSGIASCMSGYSGIVSYFADQQKQGKSFEVLCNNSVIGTYGATTFKGSNANRSENNWVVTIPYTISLQSINIASGLSGLIESYEDSWNIEPLEEIYFYDNTTSSPLYTFGQNSQTTINDKPPSLTDLSATTKNINIRNFLQYRISHRVSAVGLSIDRTNTNNPNPGGTANTNNGKSPAYAEACKWVMDRCNQSYGANSQNGVFKIFNDTGVSGLRLYNHVRSIESNVSAGSYSVTDTWLALGTGVKFTEDFTFEIATDDKFIKTVTLNGTVKGLESTDPSGYIMFDFPSGSMTGYVGKNFPGNFPRQSSANNRFSSAILGYQSGIKPYLYERASLALAAVAKPTGQAQGQPPMSWIAPVNNGRLNITPINYNETLNPAAGTVSYSVVYSNKPGSWLSGVLSSTLTVSDTNPSDQVAETFVLGRPLGPIIEKVGTTKSERRLSLEVLYPSPTGYNDSHPNSPQCVIYSGRAEYQQLKQLVDSFRPISPVAFATLVPTSSYGVGNNAGIVFKTSDSSTWNPFEGRFSWEVTWIYSTGIC